MAKPRMARVNEALRQVVADELERIDDDRLSLLTVTGVWVDQDLRRAAVWFSSLEAPDSDHADELEVLAEHRPRLQAAVARQLRMKRTPELRFEADPAWVAARRVEGILRSISVDSSSDELDPDEKAVRPDSGSLDSDAIDLDPPTGAEQADRDVVP
ncbi:MAG: 30S ribosome-binding factor RbfA [Acidimicrobiales bacterium]